MRTIIYLLVIPMLMTSCKKTQPDNPVGPKDYSASLLGKSWLGVIKKSTDTDSLYFMLQFSADNSLIWSGDSGDYQGLWFVKENHLTLQTYANPGILTGDLGDSSRISNLKVSDDLSYEIISLRPLPDIVLPMLQGTKWRGAENEYISLNSFYLRFYPNSLLELAGFAHEETAPYSMAYNRIFRSAGDGPFIKEIFGIFLTDSTAIGSYRDAGHPLAWAAKRE